MKRLLALLCCLLLCMPAAVAENELLEEDVTIAPLPVDFSSGHVADPANFTEDGYEDDSLSVRMERVQVGKARFNVARVTIQDPSQLRTALSAPFGKKKNNKISTIARNSNAVVAIGGDYYSDRSNGYVVRQGEVYRTKLAKTLDILVIDQNADFHLVLKSNKEALQALLDSGVQPVNVFNFGPALVVDGQLQQVSDYANFNPKGKEPRCAIGQTGPLEYLLVVVDGRGKAGSEGCSLQTLAQFMADQGCEQAFNLDGGNSALMVFGEENYSEKSFSAERAVSDIIYFATAVDFGLDEAAE